MVLIGSLLIARSDRKVSYAGESNDSAEQSFEIIARLLEQQQPPVTRSNVLKILRQRNPKARILATDSTVVLGNVTFYFARGGRLERIANAQK